MKFNRFGRGGCYTCGNCGKLTRRTDENDGTHLCGFCATLAGAINSLSDNGKSEFEPEMEKCTTREQIQEVLDRAGLGLRREGQ